MSKNVMMSDPRAVTIRAKVNKRRNEQAAVLQLHRNKEELLAPTIFLVRKAGGGGGSTLALILENLMKTDCLIIEVGGQRCPAFKDRPVDRYQHFLSRDVDRVDHALDARIDAASKVAIIEFEPALYRETIPVAARFKEGFAPSRLLVFYVAGRYENNPQYRIKAKNAGVSPLFMCRQADQIEQPREDGFLRLPWLSSQIQNGMHAERKTLSEALAASPGIWTQAQTITNLDSFATAILEGHGR